MGRHPISLNSRAFGSNWWYQVDQTLAESRPVREALQSVKEDAARIAEEASRVAVEITLESEQMNALMAEVQRLSVDLVRQMQSPEWQQPWRDIERAIEEAGGPDR